jgi:hypothetical protein
MGSDIKKTFTDPISRRQFLKTSGKGIMGAAASQMIPSTGGIMETEAAKEVIREAVPFDEQEMIDIVDLIMDKGIKPKGEKYYYLTTKDGQQVRAYAPDDWELYSRTPNIYELETLDSQGRVIDSLQFEPDATIGPEGGEETLSGRTRYVEDVKYIPEGPDGDVTPEPSFSFQEDYGHYLPDQNTLDKYNTLGDIIMQTPPRVGSAENKRIERKASEDIKKMENKKPKQIEQKANLPAEKKGMNIKGVIKALAKRYPPVKVINVLQLMSQGLDLYESINEAMGMPSKEEFQQIVKDMESSEFSNGGIATVKG